jgi:beta propeller repeat protein
VVWEDQRAGNGLGDVYGYRITTRTTFAIFKGTSSQKNPAISGTQVVWEDYRGGNSDIYYTYLPDLTAVTHIVWPNGGENLIAGKQSAIQWTNLHLNDSNYVKIEYSTDNGKSFSTITDNYANSGEYVWQVPASINANQCLIRISDKNNPDTTDASDAVFSIFQCDASLTADLSGDCKVDFEDFAILSSQWLRCGNVSTPERCL